jgi:pimeloyl-ACP methyl ester carboxylesterase
MTVFPVGYHDFHENAAINFQMNRWHSSGCIGYDELMAAGKKIHNFEDWTKEFCTLAEQAREKSDLIACATCLRAAQFFTLGEKKDESGRYLKLSLYEECMDAYDKAYKDEGFSYDRIPYEEGYLPVLYKLHEKNSKGTVVMHGGYDSFIQEFVPYFNYVFEHGFNVYMFEGFGQGEVLNRSGIKMTPDWEKCTTPILDHFGLEDVTLIGVSLGGYLAARAAAFEPRIARVVLYDIIYDFYGSLMAGLSKPRRYILDHLLRHEKSFLWPILEKKIKENFFANWLLQQGCYVYGVSNLPQFLNTIKLYNTREVSPQITQDVLLLAGADDIYTVYFDAQKQALTAARSVEGRIFTREENASHHCQVGNLGLALDYIMDWIKRKQ